eukprot:Hpha_TRINITY_DN27074_c0_g1::TRINITY_DN27074_c0_g1_i1::g.33235::m.33235
MSDQSKAAMDEARRKASEAAARARAANQRGEESFVKGAETVRKFRLDYIRNPRLLLTSSQLVASKYANRLRKSFSCYYGRTTAGKATERLTDRHSGWERVDFRQWAADFHNGVQFHFRTPYNWVMRRRARVKDAWTEAKRTLKVSNSAKSFASSQPRASSGGTAPGGAGVGGAFRALVPVNVSEGLTRSLSATGKHLRELILDPQFKFRQGLYKIRRWQPQTNAGRAMAPLGMALVFMMPFIFGVFYIAARTAASRERILDEQRKAAAAGGDSLLAEFADDLGVRVSRDGSSVRAGKLPEQRTVDDVLIEHFMAPPTIGGGRRW